MTHALNYICVVILFHHSLASPIPTDVKNNPTTEFTTFSALTTLATSLPPPKQLESSPSTTTKALPAKDGRNLLFAVSHEDVLAPRSSQDNFDVSPDYQKSISIIEPALASAESYPSTFNDGAPAAVAYPLEDVDHGDMSLAESNIVFRPLFSYRQQSSEKRRVYYYQATSPPRRSRNGYPDFYKNAPYDNVP